MRYGNLSLDLRLVVQNDIQQRAVDFDAAFDTAVIFDGAYFSKFVQSLVAIT